MKVNPFKIVGWIGLAIAIVGAFTDVPYGGLLLVLLGIVGGYAIAAEDHVRVLVSALVLTALSGVLDQNIPGVGGYLTSIFQDLGIFAAGAALMIISRNIWKRYKP
jgi:hypothetical protein